MVMFINGKTFTDVMKRVKKPSLESKIAEMIDEATVLIPIKGEAVPLYQGLQADELANPYFELFVQDDYNTEGILKRWKEEQGNRTITRSQPISRQEFLKWIMKQQENVKQKVHDNLQTYIQKPATKGKEQGEFPQSEYFRD